MNEQLSTVVFLRAAYNYDSGLVSNATGLRCDDVSLAVQDAKEECDINTIVRRFGLSGELPTGIIAPTYGDFTGVSDYQSALHALKEADAAFLSYPADVRSRFDNDAGRFVDFCSDPANYDEAVKLGLAFPKSPKLSEPAVPAVAIAEVK